MRALYVGQIVKMQKKMFSNQNAVKFSSYTMQAVLGTSC